MNPAFIVPFLLFPFTPGQNPDSLVVREFLRLERIWNRAHVDGDTTTLKRLWADEISIVIPHMKPMSKQDGLSFWRSGTFVIESYVTDRVRVVQHDTSRAIVRGILRRVRNIRGTRIEESWRFEKTYVFRASAWRVVRWEAQSTDTQ